MDKQAFKQRMQNLKSYRENNPGKGYWDWKNEYYSDDRTDHPINKPNTPDIDFGIPKDQIDRLGSTFSRNKVYNKIPAREWAPGGRTNDPDAILMKNGPLSALWYYMFGNDNTAQDLVNDANKIIEDSRGQHSQYEIDDAMAYLAHEDAKDLYLGLPQRTGLLQQSDYKPSQSKNNNTKYYKFTHQKDEYWNPVIQDLLYEPINTKKQYIDPVLNNFQAQTGVDPQKGEYISIYDIWDYNTAVTGGGKDNIGKYIGGKPFEIYDRIYLDDLYNVQSTPNKGDFYGGYLPEIVVTPEQFANGGQTGDPKKERFYQATGRSSSGRPLEEGLKPVFSLEDAANMTPIGDAISAKDAYDAVKNRDWLGAGLAAVTMIPFVPTTVRNFRKKYKGVTTKREIPTVNKKAIDNAIDEAKNYRDSRIKLYQQAIEDRNASYERLIENEDALRRAVNFDKKYGTNYVKTYTKQLQNYAKSKNSPDLMQIGIKPMGANGSFDPNIPDYVFINSDYVKNGKLQPGLISHEKSHYDNQKAGALSLPIFDNRFVDTKKTKTMYPKTYDWIQRYLHNFEETKSHMNEFRTNMINKNLLKPDSKVGLKQIKDLIFNSDNDNMKKLFNTYKSKRQFVKDFNSVPITSIGDNKTLV